MTNFSLVVITKNEEHCIGRCIQSALPFTNDIVVVDSGSTDNTKAICESNGARFYTETWLGYGRTKNLANTLAKHDWILSLDADEELTVEVGSNILKALNDPTFQAFEIGFISSFCGKWIKHGAWYPDSQICLFNRKFATWSLDEVHENLIVNGKVGKLEGEINHYTVTSIEDFLDKHNNYTTKYAILKTGKDVGFLKLVLSPFWRFFTDYFIKMGFLDGFYGFVIAAESAHYVFLKHLKTKINYIKSNTTL